MAETVVEPAAPAASATPVAAPAAPAAVTPVAAPAAVAATVVTPTIADQVPAAAPAQEPSKGYWPDGWQKEIAGDDEKELKQISRYATPKDVWQKTRELEKRLSSGELKSGLPKDAKPEQVAAWRKENGIPEAPDKYDLKFDSGLVIGKEDEVRIGDFLKSAHAANFTQDQVKAAVEWDFNRREEEVTARATLDDEQRVNALDSLNREWGGAFRRNINVLEGFLSKLPESVRDDVKSARLPDGTALLNSVDAVRGLLAMALELNPAGVIVPGAQGDIGKTMVEEYNSILKMKGDDRRKYNADPQYQERERELIDAMQKHGLMNDKGQIIMQKKAA